MSLYDISLIKEPLQDINTIPYQTALTSITLSNCPVNGLLDVTAWPGLINLYVINCGVTNVSLSPDAIPGLQAIRLEGNPLTTLAFLQGADFVSPGTFYQLKGFQLAATAAPAGGTLTYAVANILPAGFPAGEISITNISGGGTAQNGTVTWQNVKQGDSLSFTVEYSQTENTAALIDMQGTVTLTAGADTATPPKINSPKTNQHPAATTAASPQTGDNSAPGLYALLALLSAAALALTARTAKRRAR